MEVFKKRINLSICKLLLLVLLNFICCGKGASLSYNKNIAVVNVLYLMHNSIIGKDLEKQSKDLLEKSRTTALHIEEALRKEKEAANSINKNLNRDEYTNALNSYNEKYNNFINLSKKLKYSWERSVTNARIAFFKFINTILLEMKKKYGYSIVLDSSNVLFYSPEQDITMDVIKIMDSKKDFKILLKYEE